MVLAMVTRYLATLMTLFQLIFISHRLNCLKRSHRNHGNHRNFVILQAKFYMCNFASKILYAMTDNEITYEIRGAIYDVYKTLGPGLLESVYEEALVFELEQRGLKVERQRQVPILYKGNVLKTDLRLDLLVEDQVIVELKSVEEMKKVFSKQLLTYLRLMNKKVGLLVNFNTDNILMSIDRVAN